jgi:predicted DNA-binding protein YlxM (UPF0122 family)
MKTRKRIGRPTVDTPDVRRKMEEAAALDASPEEIAFYADISRDSYYEILKRDPTFSDRIQALRQRPILKARQTINEKMAESYANAMDYLKRKRKAEFGEESRLEVKTYKPFEITPEQKEYLDNLMNESQ